MIKILSSSILMVLITIAVTFLVINLQYGDSKRLQTGSEKWNEEIEENFEVLADEELYIDIVATLEPTLESELAQSSTENDDFDINLFIKGKKLWIFTREVLKRQFKDDVDYGVYVNSTFKIEKEIFFDSIWNPRSSYFQKYGRRYIRRLEMFDYKMKSQNETIKTYEYKGSI